MENELNPFTAALDYTQTADFWIVVALPLTLLLVAAIIYFFLYRIRKKQEIADINNLENLQDGDVPGDDEMDALERQWQEPGGEFHPVQAKLEDKDADLFAGQEEVWTAQDESGASQEEETEDDISSQDLTESEELEPQESEPQEIADLKKLPRTTWLQRLQLGLTHTRQGLQKNLSTLFKSGAKIDAATLESLHETLYRADVGTATADTLVAHLKNSLKNTGQSPNWENVRRELSTKITSILKAPLLQSETLNYPEHGPCVILVVGVNGVGKTTSIGKLASYFLAQDKSVLLCAGDTFRAAAIEQLKVWGDRLGVDVVSHKQGSDPAAVAYDGVKAAIARKKDVLLIDTAGRLHNKEDLMKELAKITKVIKKDLPDAPHETLLVIDATTGQNAFQQVSAFKDVTPVSGLIVTKLDGTAKGGVVIGVCHQFNIPIRFIGVGEKATDFQPFVPEDFSNYLFDEN